MLIASLPAAGPFSYSFRIPASLASGDWFAATQAYDGGGPVAPGPAQFPLTMGARLDASFEVTSAPPGWADYTSIMATHQPCSTCLGGGSGYDIVRADGFLATFASAPKVVGNAGNLALGGPVVASAFTPDAGGYWLLGSDGGVLAYGGARFFGSAAAHHLSVPFAGLAPAPDGGGYTLATAAGGIFPFGDAGFHG